MAVVGQAEVVIAPVFTGFEASLRSQLQPLLTNIQSQLTPAFAKAGASAATSFNENFTKTLGNQVGNAVSRAVGGRGVTDAAKTAGAQFGANLTTEAGSQVSKNLSGAVSNATRATSRQMAAAGEQSGRVFGSGFGEGFAALAAFAIAARVKRFFQETVQDAVAFEAAFAGVRRVIEGTPAQFSALSASITEMSERLPFAASGIANVAAEAGRLGVPLQNVEQFTETILKFATITAQAPEAVATSFAKFATVTQTPIGEVEHLADVVLKLGTSFAANETEILDFTRRLAPLAALTKATGEDVLALATGIVQAGGRAESGGTAIISTFDKIQQAAKAGGEKAAEFSAVIGTQTVDAFQKLVANDPTEAFVRFLEGIKRTGTDSAAVLDNLGLGSQRVSIQLRALAASSDSVKDALDKSKQAAGELDKQFSIFGGTAASRLKILSNELENTRIKLGGVLAVPFVLLLKPLAALNVATVGLATAFAGAAASGFAFVRLSNIFREFSKTLGGGGVSAQELAIGMKIAAANGTTLSNVLRGVTREKITLAEADTRLIAGDQQLAASMGLVKTETVGFVAAFKGAKAALIENAIATDENALAARANLEILTATRLAASQTGPQFAAATPPILAHAEALVVDAEAAAANQVSNLAAGRAAFTAAGGFGLLIGALGKLTIYALIADLATQAAAGIQDFFLNIGRSKENVPLATAELQKLLAGIGDVDKATDAMSVNLAELHDFVIPGTREIAEGLNKLPLIGRVVRTEAEGAKDALKGMNEALLDILNKLGPEAAKAALKLETDFLKGKGVSDRLIKIGLEPFNDALKAAEAGQKVLGASADAARANLAAMGVQGAEATAILEGLGIAGGDASDGLTKIISSSEAAKNALARLTEAQSTLQDRVKSLIQPVSGLIAAQQKLGKAAGKSGKDTLSAARAIADAERALAEARKDANRRIADAQRRLADAEADAARRILDARRALEDSRLDSTRRLRDATEELQDFQRALERVGGPQTEEDFIRLRELQEALADATQDATNKEIEGQRKVADARREGAEKTADAQRNLIQVQEDAADKIADALRRLARAHEDAARKSEAASARISDAVNLSISAITKGFRSQAGKLNQFADLMAEAQKKVLAAFGGDRNLADAFLSDLNDMGVGAIPILKNLVGSSDKQLAGLGKAFESQIKAAKRAADFQFKKFPPNFKQAIKPAIDNIFTEMDRGIGAFDMLGDKSGSIATEIGTNLQNLAKEFLELAAQSGIQLNAVEQHLLDLANSTKDPTERVGALRQLIEKLRSRDLSINVHIRTDEERLAFLQKITNNPQLVKNLEINLLTNTNKPSGAVADGSRDHPFYVHGIGGAAFGATISGPFARSLPRAQFGSTSQAGMPLLVGHHTAEELFLPNSGGAVFSHRDTERILRALRVVRSGGLTQITVNEVASDPLATARAVSFQIGSGGAVR